MEHFRATREEVETSERIRVAVFQPDQPGTTTLLERGFRPLHDLIGGELEFLGILSHADGLDELAFVYNADQTDETVPINIAGIRGPIVGIRCDETGETVSLRDDDRKKLANWLRSH